MTFKRASVALANDSEAGADFQTPPMEQVLLPEGSTRAAAEAWAASRHGNAALQQWLQDDQNSRNEVVDRARESASTPLPQREKWEAIFDRDFSDVRVHGGQGAAAAALDARAFVVGNDIIAAEEQLPDEVLTHELTHVAQGVGEGTEIDGSGAATGAEAEADRAGAQALGGGAVTVEARPGGDTLHRWTLPTDWLDYIGLGVDLIERAYIEVAYEEGPEKDYQRAVNNLFFALDAILATLPAAGGGGLMARGSRRLAAAGWGALPASAQSAVIEEFAKLMSWDRRRAMQFVHRFFMEATSDGGGGDGGGQDHGNSNGGSGNSPKGPLKGQQATDEAAKLGFDQRISPQKAPFNSHGQPVFSNGKKFITPDADGHIGGVWKMFDRKGRRLGTYDANLKWIGD